MSLSLKDIEIYYDGLDIQKYAKEDFVKGFTTNPSILKTISNDFDDYVELIHHFLKLTNKKPISFQLCLNDYTDLLKQAIHISSLSTEIFIKVPIIKSNGVYNSSCIKDLHQQKVPLNITAIFTHDHINSLKDCFQNNNTKVIISLFVGRIRDTGTDFKDLLNHTKKTFRNFANVKILWASCRSIYDIKEAIAHKFDIITIPDSVISKLDRLEMSLDKICLDTVNEFYNDFKLLV